VIVFDVPGRLRLVRRRRLAADGGILHRLLDLGILDVDLCGVIQVFQRLLGLLLGELADDGVLHLIEGRQRTRPFLLDLDDVPTELRLNRIGDLAFLQLEGGVLERLQHLPAAEKAEIAAFGARVLRFLLGNRGKILALLQPLLHFLGLGLGRHQDVAGVNLFLRLHAGDLGVVDLLGLVLRHGIAHALVEIRIPQRAAAMIFEAVLEGLPAVETGLHRGLGHQLILDDELQQHAAAIVRREIGELSANFGGSEIEIGLLDVDAVDRGDDWIVGVSGERNASNKGCDEQQGSPGFHGVRSSSCARLTVAGG
jgi:hypothetical protein